MVWSGKLRCVQADNFMQMEIMATSCMSVEMPEMFSVVRPYDDDDEIVVISAVIVIPFLIFCPIVYQNVLFFLLNALFMFWHQKPDPSPLAAMVYQAVVCFRKHI